MQAGVLLGAHTTLVALVDSSIQVAATDLPVPRATRKRMGPAHAGEKAGQAAEGNRDADIGSWLGGPKGAEGQARAEAMPMSPGALRGISGLCAAPAALEQSWNVWKTVAGIGAKFLLWTLTSHKQAAMKQIRIFSN